MNTTALPYKMVSFGEMLWDLLPSGPQPGGAPMNITYHLGRLGITSALISRIGNDERGDDLLKVLLEKGIPADFVQHDPNTPTGIVHAVPDEHHEMHYEIVAPAAWDHIVADERTKELVRNAAYFIFGSLSARHADSKATLFSLLELAQKKVFDINLRTPFYNRELIEKLLSKADILKMNKSELQLMMEWFSLHQDLQDGMTFIQEQFNIPTIIVTLGAEGAMMNRDGKHYAHPGYRVQVADTVGSGDSFLAALLAKLDQGVPAQEALAFAAALGALVASKSGGCPDYSIEEVRGLQ
ncbi:carbohydrate kinase [Parasegetibacter sp. NRK P23]|uniref:carbohydrate kinase family protein n=1 Tax=Parasegetibacter sp. NRK P23 TaxID=2942999 RepID=UPI002043850C|nr:carbohydrate kinase [Parasegetibacter sp. NRK P23]MCM5529612.1 carbohydrate kinase [Parasegetibacter sp. NRK P23]